MGRVHVEESALMKLKEVFGTAGENYKTNYDRLTALIREITSGHIQGDPADEMLKKYEEKKESFESVLKMINSTQDYFGGRTGQFIDDMEALLKNMK